MSKDKSEITKVLDETQTYVYLNLLKRLDFRKKGRTFNRSVNGLVQVINFQTGQYPIGNYVVPGIRESLYGQFTINIGIYLPEISELEYNQEPKDFAQEYHCAIRTRIGNIFPPNYSDYWWKLNNSPETLSADIIDKLDTYCLHFFDSLNSRENILQNIYTYSNKIHMGRIKLDLGLIYYKLGKTEKTRQLFQSQLDESGIKGHKEYILKLSKKLGIVLN